MLWKCLITWVYFQSGRAGTHHGKGDVEAGHRKKALSVLAEGRRTGAQRGSSFQEEKGNSISKGTEGENRDVFQGNSK